MKYFFLIIRTVFFFSLLVFAATFYYDGKLVGLNGGVSDLSEKDPAQSAIADGYSIDFDRGIYTYHVEPVDKYLISGVVVKRTDYSWFNNDADSAIQYDVCIVWGANLKDNLYLSDNADYTQFKRSCYYNFSRDNGFAKEQFANNRLILKNDSLFNKARSLNVGDEIAITGRLANITAYKKTDTKNPLFEWKTSRAREDSGDSASEIIYVDAIDVLNPAHYKESIMNYFAFWVAVVTAGLLVLYFIGILLFMVPQKRKDNY